MKNKPIIILTVILAMISIYTLIHFFGFLKSVFFMVLGVILFFIVYKVIDYFIFAPERNRLKREENEKIEHKAEERMMREMRRQEAYMVKQPDYEEKEDQFTIITLSKKLSPADAYYENRNVRIEFNVDDIFKIKMPTQLTYASRHMAYVTEEEYQLMKNEPQNAYSYESYLQNIIESRKIQIFSKIENKYIDEVKKEKWARIADPMCGIKGYSYYLPDGTPFYSITTQII